MLTLPRRSPQIIVFICLCLFAVILWPGFQTPNPSRDKYALHARERLNIQACCTLSDSPADTNIANLILNNEPYPMDTGDFKIDYALSERALSIVETYQAGQYVKRASLLTYFGKSCLNIFENQGRDPLYLEKGIAALEEARDLLRAKQDTINEMMPRIYMHLGNLYLFNGDSYESENTLKNGINLQYKISPSANMTSARMEVGYASALSVMQKQDSCIHYYQKGMSMIRDSLGEDHWLYKQSEAILVGYYYYQWDYEKALESALAYLRGLPDEPRFLDDKSITHNVIAYIHLSLGYYNEAIKNVNKAIALHQQMPAGSSPIESSNIYYTKGHIYQQLGESEKALNSFLKSLNILKAIHRDESFDGAYSYSAVGEMYRFVGELELSRYYMEKALQIRKRAGEAYDAIAASYYSLGSLYKSQKQYEKALFYFKQSLELRRQFSAEGYLINNYLDISHTLIYLKDYQAAIDTLQEVLRIQDKITNPNYALTYVIKGDAYLRAGQYDLAFENLEKAKHYGFGFYGNTHPKLADFYTKTSAVYFEKGQFDLAINQLDSALALNRYTSIDQIYDVLSLNQLITTLVAKGGFLKAQYEKIKDQSLLLQSSNCYQQALEVIAYMQQAYKSKDSKVDIINRGFYIFEDAIEVELMLDQKSEKAFQIAEQTKSYLLRHAYYESQARDVASVPASYFEEEERIKHNILALEDQLQRAKSASNVNDSLVNALKDQVFDLLAEKRALIKAIENKYPEYFNLKYKSEVPSIEEVQNNVLRKGQALIEYLVGDSSIYAFVIQPEDYRVVRIKKEEPLEVLVEEMRNGLFAYFTSSHKSDSLYQQANQQYIESSHQLYNILMAPLEAALEGASELIIIPDGALANIPFEALLMDIPENPRNFNQYQFLINGEEELAVSYAFSATLWQEITQKRVCADCQSFLAVAPTYSDNFKLPVSAQRAEEANSRPVDGLLDNNLKNSKEIAAIMEHPDDIVASKSQFLDDAENHCAIYLSVHGKANTEYGESSMLMFPPPEDSTGYDPLLLKEIYNVQMPAELVVIAGCETGIGEMRRGEGVISFARGFSHAGVKTLVTSLWQVDSDYTHKLMKYFHQYLKEGMPKNVALSRAKRTYLSSSVNAEPYIWAGFIAIGDTSALGDCEQIGTPKRRGWLVGLAAVFAIGIGLLFMRRKSAL
jgi:CHAT domain-containing protein